MSNFNSRVRAIQGVGKLLDNGYKVIPVNSKGVPAITGHLDKNTSYSHIDAKRWVEKYPLANVAVVCGYNSIVALDFDIDDPTIAAVLRRHIILTFNRVSIRGRNSSSRFAALFVADDSLRGITQIISNVYHTTIGGKKVINQIEYNANKLLTIYGLHRKTKEEYRWQGKGPLKTITRDLPTLSKANLDEIFKIYHYHVEKDKSFSKIYDVRQSKSWEKTTFDNVEHPDRFYTEEEIDEILEQCNGDSRQGWLDVGLALHKYYDGSSEGLDRWCNWAEQYEGYAGRADQEYNWSKFDSSGPMSIHVIERRNKIKTRKEKLQQDDLIPKQIMSPEDELEYYLGNYVFIQDGNLVGDIKKRNNESLAKLPELLKYNCNKTITIETTDGRSGKPIEKTIPVMKLWMTDPNRINAWGIGYAPGADRIIPPGYWYDKRERYYNEYVPPIVKQTEDAALLPYFINHMKYLFPNDGHTWVVNWMAQLVQEPERRYRTSPFSISVFEETGRGWLTVLLSKLVGVSNFRTVKDIADIARPGAKSGYLKNSTLMVINEVYVAGRARFSLLQQLKTMLSDDLQEIDVKYGSHEYNEPVYTRVFFQSNHIDGLVIDENDSRIQPFINRSRPRPKEYYDKIYGLLEDDNRLLNQIYTYLMNYPIDHHRLMSSEDTEDRKSVILSTKSITGLAFHEFEQLVGEFVFTEGMLGTYIDEFIAKNSNEPMSMVNAKEFAFLKKSKLVFSKIISVKDRSIPILGFHHIDDSDDELFQRLLSARGKITDYFKLLRKQEVKTMEVDDE